MKHINAGLDDGPPLKKNCAASRPLRAVIAAVIREAGDIYVTLECGHCVSLRARYVVPARTRCPECRS